MQQNPALILVVCTVAVHMCLFRYGSVIFVNAGEEERRRQLALLKPFIIHQQGQDAATAAIDDNTSTLRTDSECPAAGLQCCALQLVYRKHRYYLCEHFCHWQLLKHIVIETVSGAACCVMTSRPPRLQQQIRGTY